MAARLPTRYLSRRISLYSQHPSTARPRFLGTTSASTSKLPSTTSPSQSTPQSSTTTTTTTVSAATSQTTQPPPNPKPRPKTLAELDEEMRLKMAGLAGDGGEAGVELEDGQPVSMKRGVRNNMFRYI